MERKNRCYMVEDRKQKTKNKKNRLSVIGYLLSVICCLASVICSPIYGEEGSAGTYGALLNFWGNDARALGMGGNLSGLANDASAGYYNPAGLVQLNTQELSFMHTILFSGTGTSLDILTYGRPASATSGFGTTILHQYTPDIPREGGGVGYSYTNREVACLLTYSTKLVGPVWMGVNGKLYFHQMIEYTGFGYGADAGLFFFPDGLISIGINVQNAIKPSIKMISESIPFPLVLRTGLSCRPYGENLAVTTEMIWAEYRDPIFGAGVEYRPIQMLSVRAGITSSMASFGCGIWQDQKRYEARLDYAFIIPYETGGLFGFGHNISLSLFFGGYRAKAITPTFAFSPTSPEEGKNAVWIYFDVKPRTKVSQWQVLVRDEPGTVVRKIGAWGEPPYRVAWDGKDDNALLVPDGRYYYSLKIVETGGKTWECEGFLASLYTVGPPGTVVIKPKGETPKYIMEERREKQAVPSKEQKKTTKKRR